MSYRAPPAVQQVLRGQTRVLEPRSTDEINGTIRQSRPSHRGYRVDHVPKPLFSSTQRLDRLSALCDFTVALRDSLDQINRSWDVVTDVASLIFSLWKPFFGICISAIMMGRIVYCKTTCR